RLVFTVANLEPNVSVHVDGNRLKISPHVKKIRPANNTKAQGLVPRAPTSQYATPPAPKAIAMVGSRPMRSETQPKNGRATPFITLSKISATVSVEAPRNSTVFETPLSLATTAICAVAMSPLAEISTNIRYSSQNVGVLSISMGEKLLVDCRTRAVDAAAGASPGSGPRSSHPTRNTTPPWTRPNQKKVAAYPDDSIIMRIGITVSAAPAP